FSIDCVFFFTLPRRPRSTLFPYTTLFRSTIAPRYLVHFTNNHGVDSWCHLGGTSEALSAWAAEPVWNALGVPERMGFNMYGANRSEEHTSELQSRENLVCRLLLEKKKNNT